MRSLVFKVLFLGLPALAVNCSRPGSQTSTQSASSKVLDDTRNGDAKPNSKIEFYVWEDNFNSNSVIYYFPDRFVLADANTLCQVELGGQFLRAGGILSSDVRHANFAGIIMSKPDVVDRTFWEKCQPTDECSGAATFVYDLNVTEWQRHPANLTDAYPILCYVPPTRL